MKRQRLEDYFYEPATPGMMGGVYAVSSDPEVGDEAIRLLHEAVKEVTGKEVEVPPKRRIGFLD